MAIFHLTSCPVSVSFLTGRKIEIIPTTASIQRAHTAPQHLYRGLTSQQHQSREHKQNHASIQRAYITTALIQISNTKPQHLYRGFTSPQHQFRAQTQNHRFYQRAYITTTPQHWYRVHTQHNSICSEGTHNHSGLRYRELTNPRRIQYTEGPQTTRA
jgi:hypothetical protein